MRAGDTVTVVKFICAQCGAEDHEKVFAGEPAGVAINCWACKSGRGMDVGMSLQTGKGMFRAPAPAEVAN